jgi:hypothetical protein
VSIAAADRVVEQLAARDRLPGVNLEPTAVSTAYLRMIRRLTGCADPFAARKEIEIRMARRALEAIELPPAEDLAARLRLAVAGNAIDFFRPFEQVRADLAAPAASADFAVDHSAEVVDRALHRAAWRAPVVYLADNAGEALFDLPFLRALAQRREGVFLVVKGAPSQNDLTRDDLARIIAGDPARPVSETLPFTVVDTGTGAVGTPLDEISEATRRLVTSAAVIIAKGMANFETLRAEQDLPPIAYAMIAKCEPNARLAGVPCGRRLIRLVQQ